jgi:hypothetical protein
MRSSCRNLSCVNFKIYKTKHDHDELRVLTHIDQFKTCSTLAVGFREV